MCGGELPPRAFANSVSILSLFCLEPEIVPKSAPYSPLRAHAYSITHTIYVAEPWEEDLGDLVTVRIYRYAAAHRNHEDDAAAAIARRYGERYPAEAAAIVLLADYCK